MAGKENEFPVVRPGKSAFPAPLVGYLLQVFRFQVKNIYINIFIIKHRVFNTIGTKGQFFPVRRKSKASVMVICICQLSFISRLYLHHVNMEFVFRVYGSAFCLVGNIFNYIVRPFLIIFFMFVIGVTACMCFGGRRIFLSKSVKNKFFI